MTTMCADECRVDAAERVWLKWLRECERLIGRSLAQIEEHTDLHDLYLDGCTPSEAVDEVLTQGLPQL